LPEYTVDEMEKRTGFSHKMLHQLEGYMNDFLNYVPLDEIHLKVYSLKLTTIILEVGPELTSAFDVAVGCTRIYPMWEELDPELRPNREKLWRKEEEWRKRNKSSSFNDYYSFLNEHGAQKLSGAAVRIRDFDLYFMPFEKANGEKTNPEWWNTYNQLKHDKYNNRKKSTLEVALKALGALFWLIDYNSLVLGYVRFQSDIFSPVGPRLEPSLRKL
jgi:hypothetical protein